ncbi:VQ domain-containing protein [Heracleum sosnowskyi]|uniref:VQ domain-containing protein n=1 Tax=Heracleum sosnowskyi TaxID=360622 RepID=A0AAD8HK55_9APIA|nr:VQ domain-containing protein [Heracleum sosnowskyi]
MNNTNNASTDHHQWLHYYQQTTPAAANPAVMTSVGGGTDPRFSDTTSTIVTTSFTTNNTSSPNKSTSLGNNTDFHLNPQASVGKPIRRRSRAPRRNPTTLLNASTANFRSLVQQFTGCQNTNASSGSRKGPVNLSFGMPRNRNDHQIISTSSRIAPVASEYFNNQLMNPVVDDQHQGQKWQQQEMFEKLQINNTKNMQSGGLDEFAIDDLHQLINESSSFGSSVNKQNGNNYF